MTFTEGRERNIALGAWGAVGGFGAVAGVLLGGVLTDALSWEWIFYVNVPVGVAALVAAPLLLAGEPGRTTSRRSTSPGAVLVTGGLSALVYAHHPVRRERLALGRDPRRRCGRARAARRLRRLGAPAP